MTLLSKLQIAYLVIPFEIIDEAFDRPAAKENGLKNLFSFHLGGGNFFEVKCYKRFKRTYAPDRTLKKLRRKLDYQIEETSESSSSP